MKTVARWTDLSIGHKLFTVVGIMAVLVVAELATLFFAMRSLSSVRAFVAGEGLWSKAQKDAVFGLERFARTHDPQDYDTFLSRLSLPEGDHRARLALMAPALDSAAVREGFLAGGIHPDDIEPMVELLRRFHNISYLARAIDIWTRADALLEELKIDGEGFRGAVMSGRGDDANAALQKIEALNARLTLLEVGFSDALGEGSRWLERVVLLLLTLAAMTAEGVGLTLAILTSRAISAGLADLNQTARKIGDGDFSRTAAVRSHDELGQLADSLNQMGAMLRRSYSELEARVKERTAQLEAMAGENANLARAAEQAVRVRDEFISVASHELRNPLAPIVMALELSKEGKSSDKQRAILERQVKHVVRLVDDLLDVSRITRGNIQLHKERVLLSDIVAKGLEMVTPLFTERHQLLALTMGEDLWLDGDPIRLAQIVSNLLTNASKYTEHAGHISVHGTREGDSVCLRVRDTGIGISEQMLPHVFELFAQERQALDRSRGGLGLGLAIVRDLVLLHGGAVTASSRGLGTGSEFVVTLPAAARAPENVDTRSGAKVTPHGLCEILAVDDNADSLALLRECLTVLGHQPHCASNGASALVVAAKAKPQVAVLDIGLPEMDGYELAARLRSLPGLAAIKLIALTGYGQAQDRERSHTAGFNLHLVKPVTMQALREAIEHVTG